MRPKTISSGRFCTTCASSTWTRSTRSSLAAAAVLLVAACEGRSKSPPPAPAALPASSAPAPDVTGLPTNFVALAKSLDPSVVTIRTSARLRGGPLQRWLGGGEEPPEADVALGSGFVVDGRGLIVTNNHVVSAGSDVSVKLIDGRELPAKIIGRDEELDLPAL